MEILVDVDTDPDMCLLIRYYQFQISFSPFWSAFEHLLRPHIYRFFPDDVLNRFCESYLHTCHADDG